MSGWVLRLKLGKKNPPAHAGGSARPTMIENITETRLPNGLVVLTDRMPGVRSVTLGFFVRRGARHEPEALHGITHFIEHTVFKGTKKRTALEMAIEQDRLGGSLDAFTTHEETGFAIKVIDDQLPAAFDLVSDMLLDPKFEPLDLEAEQKVIIEEMKMVEDDPDDLIGDIFNASFFPNSPLGRTITGTPESVRSFDREITQKYHAENFTPENFVVVAAGNVEHSEIVELASRRLSGWRPAGRRDGGATPEAAAPIVIKQNANLEQAHLIIATPFPDARDERRYAADLLANILGGGTSSRLWQKVREERGLAYNVGASSVTYLDAGLFSIGAATSPDQVKDVVELSIAEMKAVVADGITADELELSKQSSRTAILLSLEDSASRSAAIAQSEMTHGRQIPVEETLAKFDAVTLDDCQQLASEFFTTENIAFVALGDLPHVSIDRESLSIN